MSRMVEILAWGAAENFHNSPEQPSIHCLSGEIARVRKLIRNIVTDEEQELNDSNEKMPPCAGECGKRVDGSVVEAGQSKLDKPRRALRPWQEVGGRPRAAHACKTINSSITNQIQTRC